MLRSILLDGQGAVLPYEMFMIDTNEEYATKRANNQETIEPSGETVPESVPANPDDDNVYLLARAQTMKENGKVMNQFFTDVDLDFMATAPPQAKKLKVPKPVLPTVLRRSTRSSGAAATDPN